MRQLLKDACEGLKMSAAWFKYCGGELWRLIRLVTMTFLAGASLIGIVAGLFIVVMAFTANDHQVLRLLGGIALTFISAVVHGVVVKRM